MAGITKLLDLAQMPARTQDQQTFDIFMAALLQNLPTWGAELNETLAAINVLAAGGAYAIPYKVSTTTTDADPGAGFLRFNSATQNAATVVRLDLTGADARDYTALLDTFDASTSTIKGTIRICKAADPSAFVTFDVTARAAPSGYRNITVTPGASSSASPFANNEAVILVFQRTGDKGDLNPWSYLKVSHRTASGTPGGTATTGSFNTRQLNTVESNTITGASLASNTVTLPAGTYIYSGRAGVYASVANHKLCLRNTTDSTYDGIGSSAATGGSVQTDSFVSGRLVLAASKNFQLWHYFGGGSASTSDLGVSSGSGQVEVHAELEFIKIA